MGLLLDRETTVRLRTFLAGGDKRKVRGALAGLIAGIALVLGALLAYLTPIGAVAAIAAGLVALLVLRDVRWGLLALVAVICLLPFGSLPFKIGFTPTFLDLVFGGVYAVWAVRLVTRRQNDFVLTPLGLPFLILVALAVFSFLLGLSHSTPSANDLRTFAEVVMGFGIFLLVINNVRDRPLLRQLTAGLILAGTAEAGIGVFLYLIPRTWAVRVLNPLGRLGYPVGMGALRYINDDPDLPLRAIGTNVDPNILGALLVIVASVAMVQLFAKRPVLPRAWLAACVGTMGLGTFLTYSRGSMVGLVAAVGAVAVLRYRRLLLVLVVVGTVFVLLPQTQAYIDNFVQGILVEDRSTQMRMGEYKDTIVLILRYPWVGVGFVGTPDIDLYLAVANLYLAVAGHMGMVGLAAFLAVITMFFVYGLRAWRAVPMDSPMEPFLVGYGAAVFGSLVAGVFDHTLLTYPHAVALLWLTLGMGTASARVALLTSRETTEHSPA